MAAVYCTADGLFSADKPGLVVPDANHFVAVFEQHKAMAGQRRTILSGGTSNAEGAGLLRRLPMISVGNLSSPMLWGIA